MLNDMKVPRVRVLSELGIDRSYLMLRIEPFGIHAFSRSRKLSEQATGNLQNRHSVILLSVVDVSTSPC